MAASRIEAIIEGIRAELQQRPGSLEGGGLAKLVIECFFDPERNVWVPRETVVRAEFRSRKATRTA